MLTRLAATASGIVLCATTVVVVSPSAARADCEVVKGVVYCDASDSENEQGSNRSNNNDGNAPTGPGAGCQNQGNGIPVAACTEGALGQLEDIPSIDLAWQARGNLQPPVAKIRWTPDPRTYVQMRTGFWLEPAVASVDSDPITAGGQTVTAHAAPKHVEWNLVEDTIQCPTDIGPGSTQCGYEYHRSSASQPGGKYQITATIVWGVTWDCAGDCDPGAGGPLDDIVVESTALLPVDEIQTESQPG